ncbi:NUDIX domain-containing protein [Halomonas maura]|uniref:NUDIX domain-containing protein n=1 Tax=Halomonas maura TaxID=117606 RepID=UPI0025B3A8E4|nr:NUDIX hydrolase [Halomonas maura]MDN3557716.1 NUDIX hydrolase [Halomonas maura]
MIGASAAIIRNGHNEIVIVKPTYRKEWLLPGGAIEENESPQECCKRECLEELNVSIDLGELLCLEYRKATDDVRFIFDGGILSEEGDIRLPEEELESYRLVAIDAAIELVDRQTARRLVFMRSGLGIYFES